MSIAAIEKQIEALTKRKSMLARAEELEVYLEAVDSLEIAVRIPATSSVLDYCRSLSSDGFIGTHHDALPEAAQEILRAHMREALQEAIRVQRSCLPLPTAA